MLCVSSPRGAARLVYMPVSAAGRGPGRTIDATITRAGSSRADRAASFRRRSDAGTRRCAGRCVSAQQRAPPVRTAGCTLWFPATPALAKLHTPRVVGCVPSGAPFVYSGPTSRRVIALTFDDGPWPDTPQFLDVLEREHVHATFFQIGEQVGTYGAGGRSPDARRRRHDRRPHLEPRRRRRRRPFAAAPDLRDGGGDHAPPRAAFSPCLFRAPGGAVSCALISEARSMGFTTINWDVDPRDWARPGTGAIYANVIANAHHGAIVIQHDGGGDRSADARGAAAGDRDAARPRLPVRDGHRAARAAAHL